MDLNEIQEYPHTLQQQIAALSKNTDALQDRLQRLGRTVPRIIIEDLDYLAANLESLSHLVGKKEEESNNLMALAAISQVINSSLNLDDVLRIVMDTIVRLTGAERGFLMLRDQPDGELIMRLARNWEQESIASNEFAISRTVVDRVINEGQAILTTNAQEDPRFGGHESIIAYNLRSILCVPLKVKDVLTGVIYADNRIRSGIFTETERNLLSAFANQAAVAIENARLFASLRKTLAEVTALKNLMDNVFASIVSGVITTDISDTITLCNRATESILGKSAGEIMGSSLHLALPPIAQELDQYLTRVRDLEQSFVGLEFTPNLPDRGPAVWSLNLSPLKDANHGIQGVAIVLDDLTEKKRLEAERRLFERMVSPAVIQQLDPNKLQLGGKRAHITTLFADIRGYTQFSEQLNPEQLFAVLNQYLAAAADAILENEGTIDKFMGDAVMAWFNAPIPQPDHTLRAVKTALGIRDAVNLINRAIPEAFHLAFGIGIHYGEAFLGLVGTEKRLEYTAIGDSVNTAKRIQENSQINQILISESAFRLVQEEITTRQVNSLVVKGKAEPIQVFEVLSLIH